MLGKKKTRSSGSFIMNKVFAGGTVKLTDIGNAQTFILKGSKLKTYGESKNASEKVSLMLVEP